MSTLAPGAIETDFGGGTVRDYPALNRMVAAQTALGRAGRRVRSSPVSRLDPQTCYRALELANPRPFYARESIEAIVAQLRAICDIGDWTAHHIELRAAREPDALLLRSVAQQASAGAAAGARWTVPSVARLCRGAPLGRGCTNLHEEIMMSENAKTFRQLHDGPGLLLLANCWDAGSARVLESLGARALATTSAGLSWSNGYPDGDALPVELLVASVRAITRVIQVPLTVDVEGGYSSDPATVAETIAALIDAGAVGINLEDGAAPPDLLEAKIERVKQRAAQMGVDLFVNARTDVYLRGLVPEPARVEECLARARRYLRAGADGLFVPKLVEAQEIQAITSSIALPLNVLAWPKLAPASELPALGVRRLSSGSALAQVAFGRAATAASAFLRDGRTDLLSEGALPYAEMNPLFARPSTLEVGSA